MVIVLTVEGLRFYYHPNRIILKDISLTLADHDILCLLGPNGTGKTTLLRCLLALNKAVRGSIKIDGLDLTKIGSKKRAMLMAYVPQATTMAFPYEAREVVLMGRVAHLGTVGRLTIKEQTIADEVMERLEIQHLSRYPFNEMSGGERQMILVARALAQQARILIMDEPTANLDISNQVKILQVMNALAEQGYSILMTTHFPDHAFFSACNKVVMIRDGLVMAQGDPNEVVTTESLSRLYATPIIVTRTALSSPRIIKVCIPIVF